MAAATPSTETYTLTAMHYTHGATLADPKVIILPVAATVADAVAELRAIFWPWAQTVRLLPNRDAPAFDDGVVLRDAVRAYYGDPRGPAGEDRLGEHNAAAYSGVAPAVLGNLIVTAVVL